MGKHDKKYSALRVTGVAWGPEKRFLG